MNKETIIDELEKLKNQLPQFCFTLSKAKTEPINLIFLSDPEPLKTRFLQAGWLEADRQSPISLAKALLATIFNLSYPTWPFTPYQVNGQIQKFSFQKALGNSNHRGRHHLRIWATSLKTSVNREVWVCAASAETGMKFSRRPLFLTHKINPDLDAERDFVVDQLKGVGASALGSIDLTGHHEGKNYFDDYYFTDGKAAVLEVD